MDDDKAEGGAPPTRAEKDPSELLGSAAGADGVEEKDDTAEPLTSLFGGIGSEEIEINSVQATFQHLTCLSQREK